MTNTIKAERALLNLTQSSLAITIGVSRQTINYIEKNNDIPSTLIAMKMSRLFSKPVNDFFQLEDSDDHC